MPLLAFARLQYRGGTMRPGYLSRFGAIVIVAALAGGCASVFERPEVRLEGVRLSGVGLRGATLLARLHIDNPNGFDLESRSMSYQLELQDPASTDTWLPLAQDTIEQKIEVGANSDNVVEIPIDFSYSELGPALRALLDRGTFGYRVSGRIDVAKPISRSVPYRKTGRITLDGVR
jgi:LEA14-like dessication related protein